MKGQFKKQISILKNTGSRENACFSNYKTHTVSTTQSHTTLNQDLASSSDSDNSISKISEFKMYQQQNQNPKNHQNYQFHQKQQNNTKKCSLLTFASVGRKLNLQKRIGNFIKNLQQMIKYVHNCKKTRKSNINKYQKNEGKKSKIALTFKMIGNYLKEDVILNQLTLQQQRLQVVLCQIEQLKQIISKSRRGYEQEQIIQLMNTINRIQQHCQYLCKTIQQFDANNDN